MTRKSFNALLRIHPELGMNAKREVVIAHQKLKPIVIGWKHWPHKAKMQMKERARELAAEQPKPPGFEMRRQFFLDYHQTINRKNGVGSRVVRGARRLANLLNPQELAA